MVDEINRTGESRRGVSERVEGVLTQRHNITAGATFSQTGRILLTFVCMHPLKKNHTTKLSLCQCTRCPKSTGYWPIYNQAFVELTADGRELTLIRQNMFRLKRHPSTANKKITPLLTTSSVQAGGNMDTRRLFCPLPPPPPPRSSYQAHEALRAGRQTGSQTSTAAGQRWRVSELASPRTGREGMG